MQCLLPAEAGILKAAEGGVASKTSILSRIWDICLDLTLGHPRASPEAIRTRLHTRVEHSYPRFQIRRTKALGVQL